MKDKKLRALFLIISLTVIFPPLLFAQGDNSSQKEIEALKKELAKMEKTVEVANKRVTPLKEENDKLRSERAGMYEKIGTAYTKAGLFDDAIDAYKESLKYNADNAQIHYYLGLLYQKSQKNIKKAVQHFKKYLYLNPDAKNKDEVLYIIEMIQNKR